MLNKCANPGCIRAFRKLEDGKLFLVEIEASAASPTSRKAGEGRLFRHLEHYWLCDPCASVLTLSFEQERGVVAVPLAGPMGKMPAASVRASAVVGAPANENGGRRRAALGGPNEA